MTGTPGPTRTAAARGFTLIEIMVVLAVIGLILQLVIVNLGAMVPRTRLDGEAKKFVANLDWVRSEARIQGKSYRLRLDLQHHRWRFVPPPEERVRSDQTDEELEVAARLQTWTELDEDVHYGGAGNAREGMVRTGTYDLAFDENGLTGDQIVVFKLGSDETHVWTVQIHGLTGRCEIETNMEGHEQPMPDVGEMAF
jgi:type II secretion system protein H